MKDGQGPHAAWTHHKDGPKVQPGQLADGSPQEFYCLEDHPTMPGWFKGMQGILEEHGLWLDDGLPLQCHGFKCVAGHSNCCCQCLHFMLPNFCSQCSQLE